MSLTTLTKPKRRTPGREPARYSAHCARYERKVSFAEENEAQLLALIFKAFHVEGTPFDLNRAAKIVGEECAANGWSFHESLYYLYSAVKNPGRGFRW